MKSRSVDVWETSQRLDSPQIRRWLPRAALYLQSDSIFNTGAVWMFLEEKKKKKRNYNAHSHLQKANELLIIAFIWALIAIIHKSSSEITSPQGCQVS